MNHKNNIFLTLLLTTLNFASSWAMGPGGVPVRRPRATKIIRGKDPAEGFIFVEETDKPIEQTVRFDLPLDEEERNLMQLLSEAMKEEPDHVIELETEIKKLSELLDTEIAKSTVRLRRMRGTPKEIIEKKQKELVFFQKYEKRINSLREKVYALYARSLSVNWRSYYVNLVNTMEENFRKAPNVDPREAYSYLGLEPEQGRNMEANRIKNIINEQSLGLEPGSNKMWNIRQIGYVFRNNIAKEEYDAFLEGQEAIQNLYSKTLKHKDKLDDLFNRQLRLLQEKLQNHISNLKSDIETTEKIPEGHNLEDALAEALGEALGDS